MRLNIINRHKKEFEHIRQPLCQQAISSTNIESRSLKKHDSPKRYLMRILAQPALSLSRKRIENAMQINVPFHYDYIGVNHRFCHDASLAHLLPKLSKSKIDKALVLGAGSGDKSTVFCLRNGIKNIYGIDIQANQNWDQIAMHLNRFYQANVKFIHAQAESIPLDNASVDFITSGAVMEHIRNPGLAIKELARVLKDGGQMWHCISPLYYSYGGDHCISTYGIEHGYDHLLLDEEHYRLKVHDMAFFESKAKDRYCNAWAILNQFSFWTIQEYLNLFSCHFKVEHLVINIMRDSLTFRSRYPSEWRRLIASGVSEVDLLIDGMWICLRK